MRIEHIPEPKLLFGHGQYTEDPRDGLLLFGPYERWHTSANQRTLHSVSIGVIGTSKDIENYKLFIERLKKPIMSQKRQKNGALVSNELQRPSFPGLETVFGIHVPEQPSHTITLDYTHIQSVLRTEKNKRVRTSRLMELYVTELEKAENELDVNIDLWIVLVPNTVFKTCRSSIGKDFSSAQLSFLKQEKQGQGSLFSMDEMLGDSVARYAENSADFHNLLKATANQRGLRAPVQLILESKLRFRDVETNHEYSDDMKAHVAWSLCTSLYYKLGKKPWKLNSIRSGVCYLGLVFKQFPSPINKHYACSAAQLFLSDGDGAVFRGNNGLWLSKNEKEFHLDNAEAFRLMDLALTDYHANNKETYPTELFIHGRANFHDDEWSGFLDAVKKHECTTELIGIVIREKSPLKLFRDVEGEKCDYGIMRGLAMVVDDKEAYLFTRGFVPRLQTSLSLETPNPLHIRIARGNCHLRTVLEDIMALTKLNYNTCIYGDGKPVTLRFSDSIGSILTATDNWKEERRQFKYYI